ncbi:MAG TPA: zinc transporter ZupT [Clostridiales bacterium]|nr:zinc transporter ZupT [Clostridiales bacterium]
MQSGQFLFAIMVSLLAGLSTGIGGLLLFLFKKTNAKLISIALGFSAGVMIYISFVEMLPDAREYLMKSIGAERGEWFTLISFFIGIFVILLIDRFVPESFNPHEVKKMEDAEPFQNTENIQGEPQKVVKTGMMTALAVTIHNFPEGIATFIAASNDYSLGVAIAIAVAIHNIPEGIAVAVPVYCGTEDKKRAFVMSLLSGLSEPVGALLAFLILGPFINDMVLGMIFAAVSGIMVFISLDELLPTAREFGEHHFSIVGLIVGMLIIGIGLLLVS